LLLAANIVDLIVDDLDEVEFVKGELGIEKLLLHAGDEKPMTYHSRLP